MAKYEITGGQRLVGQLKISGNKNCVLPCIAAALLTEEEVVLTNVPTINDVKVELEILESIGVKAAWQEDRVVINAKDLAEKPVISKELASKLRASILLVGPLLARKGYAEFPHPGGCIIGKRTILPHLKGLNGLGFGFEKSDGGFKAYSDDSIAKINSVFLEERSVTATENIILAAVLGEHTIKIKNCAEEPHVSDLCRMLVSMGAKIEGVGSSTLTITGVDKLSGTEFRIGLDFVELGTYAVAAAITSGDLELTNCSSENMEPIIFNLEKMGVIVEDTNEGIRVKRGKLVANPKLHTDPWPGFPTDLMSAFIVLATQATGVSLLHDWMYESRMFFVDKLMAMGAQITIADPHRVIISGPTQLRRKEVESPDIRAGMALVLAALIAEGTSIINHADLIERGYEQVVEKLTKVGAQIKRIED